MAQVYNRMDNLITIKSFKVKEDTAKYFIVENVMVTLHNNASVFYSLFDKNKNRIKSSIISIANEDYAQWNDSDLYIEDLCINKLGLSRV